MGTFASFVDFPSFSGGFLVKEVFSFFFFSSFLFYFIFLTFALGANVSKCISESFGQSGYIPCRIARTEV